MIAWNFQRIVGTCQFRVPWFGYPCGYSSLTNIPYPSPPFTFILLLFSFIFTIKKSIIIVDINTNIVIYDLRFTTDLLPNINTPICITRINIYSNISPSIIYCIGSRIMRCKIITRYNNPMFSISWMRCQS